MPDELSVQPRCNDPVSVMVTYLQSESELLRCAAARALAVQGGQRADVGEALLGALTDPDPDVRTDAMEALSGRAEPEHMEKLLESLSGDPVREVKVAAIAALTRLGRNARAVGAVELLRALVLSRAEDRVAWEDEGSDWEDWLDIQVAAITALGSMGASEAIEDLIAARDDELAQSLDIPVFEALARMGPEGVAHLLAIIETEPGLSARRAAQVLETVDSETLRTHLDTLLSDRDPKLRCIAVGLLPGDSDILARLVTMDPDPDVRCVALAHAARLQPELMLKAIRDTDEEVQSTALRLMRPPIGPEDHEVLVDNILAWVEGASAGLMACAAENLPRWAPDRATHSLLRLCADSRRPLEARVAAVLGLGRLDPPVTTPVLVGLLSNPAQQVRTAVLVQLGARAQAGDQQAVNAIAAAIGRSLSPEDHTGQTSVDQTRSCAAMPMTEGAHPTRIRITRDGDIVPVDPDGEETQMAAASTLAAILGSRSPTSGVPEGEDTPEEAPQDAT